jgi:hypothetical protein
MLYLQLDMSAVSRLAENLRDKAEPLMQKYAADLASQTHAHIIDLATNGLHARRDRYLQALHFEQVNEVTWMIQLDAEAVWIEDGLPENFEMLDKLLNSPKAKTSADGTKYIAIPLKNGQGDVSHTAGGKEMKDAIQKEMRRMKIPFAKIERDFATGEPKLGKLHDITMKTPIKTHEGPGQGHGPVGQERQGRTGIPFLQGLRVYQKMGKDKIGRPQVQKAIMTFRMATSKQDKSEYWVHPGLPPKHFFEKGFDWALREWEKVIGPKVLATLAGEGKGG